MQNNKFIKWIQPPNFTCLSTHTLLRQSIDCSECSFNVICLHSPPRDSGHWGHWVTYRPWNTGTITLRPYRWAADLPLFLSQRICYNQLMQAQTIVMQSLELRASHVLRSTIVSSLVLLGRSVTSRQRMHCCISWLKLNRTDDLTSSI